nr:hypothetical protein [Pleurocapsa sp. MO_226.B13]
WGHYFMFNSLISIVTASITTLVISTCCVFVKPVNANLLVSPMYLKLESEKGQSKGVLQVGNTSSKPIRVRLSATAFTYNRRGVFQRLKPNSNLRQDLTPYLRYSPTEMVIPANSYRRVRLISLLPPSLPDGEYRTAIFAETLQEKTNAQGHKVGFNISIGSALYVAKGEIFSDIRVIKSNFDRSNRELQILVANNGNATAKGKINWTLKQDNKTVASGESGGTFLPQSRSNIKLNRHQHPEKLNLIDLPQGNYQLEGEIIWEKSDKQKQSNFSFDLKI